MLPQEEAKTARKHMTEKLGWAQRSLERMKSAPKDDHVAVQDHFWSFLHAAHLVWFYFGRWARSLGKPKGEAKRLVARWQAHHLTPPEATVWDALMGLRSRDAHVEPVATQQRVSNALLVRDRALVVQDRKLVVVQTLRYEVEHNGQRHDAVVLCEQGVVLLRRFISEFETLATTAAPETAEGAA